MLNLSEKCIYCGFWNTVVYVHNFLVRYNGPQKYFRFTKSSGNLEILTGIYPVEREIKDTTESNILSLI